MSNDIPTLKVVSFNQIEIVSLSNERFSSGQKNSTGSNAVDVTSEADGVVAPSLAVSY